jgi:hypothetical protein
MATPSVALNENTPTGGNYIREGDDRIREFKTQVREIVSVDHVYPASGQDNDCGKHKQLTLIESADVGTGADGYCALGAETCDGKPELVFTDEDDDSVQITKDGKLNTAALDITLALMAPMLEFIYPVGYVITLGVSTNPGTLLGVGTWTAIAGKVIVGINAGDTEFDTLDETGGAKTHLHAVSVVIPSENVDEMDGGGVTAVAVDNTYTQNTGLASSLMPYIVKYVWQRTA